VVYISKHHELFTSTEGVTLGPATKGLQELTSFFLIMDPPQHTLFRRLISAAFTPRQIAKIDDQIRASAAEIVDGLVGAGDIDFVSRCSAQLPMRTISDMIGVPTSDREAVARAAEAMFTGPSEADLAAGVDPMAFLHEQIDFLRHTAMEISRDRRRSPKDDLMTSIVQAEVEGNRLTDDQIGGFMILLSTAGNDTTKQTTTQAVWALSRNPDQKRWLIEDFDGRINSSIEEFVRFATPVLDFARTVVAETEVAGTTLRAGDKVGIFYCSANRDESKFEQPHDFWLGRSPNPHVGFGGGGVHFCLGNAVAKTQLRCMFRELLTRVPDMEVGEPEWLLPNSFVNGIRRLPVHVP
jgi:cytochrome P450